MTCPHHDGQDVELVMPFVVCASNGGPFDDDAFTAGYECGLLDAQLAAGQPVRRRVVRSDNLRQVDLIALMHGHVMNAQDTGADGWSLVDLLRANQDAL